VDLLSEMNVQPRHARTVLPGIATLFPRFALCYTQPRAPLWIFAKQSHAPEFFGRDLPASCDWNPAHLERTVSRLKTLREDPPAELRCTRKQIV
jgi:hypothetical protein